MTNGQVKQGCLSLEFMLSIYAKENIVAPTHHQAISLERKKPMSVSRRIFLKAGASAGISAAIIAQTASAANLLGVGDNGQQVPELVYQIPLESQSDALTSLSLETFSALKNTDFSLYKGALKIVEVELIEATALKLRPKLQAFSLVFKGPADLPLNQDTYKVRHKELRAFKLLIVPFKQDEKGVYYEAIFNRLRS